jgi:glycosyltransferase involved in cell wall biosynthesis
MDDLAVTVIIPSYNRASLVTRAVMSALSAIAPGDEVIVVDDGSTDKSHEALGPYLPRIRYLRIEHAGVGAARNRGVEASRNPLVAFLDSDDEWMPDKLQLQRVLMQKLSQAVFTFTDFGFRSDRGEEQHRYLKAVIQDSRSWEEILGPGIAFSSIAELPRGTPDFNVYIGDLYAAQLEHAYALTSTVVVRREAAGDALRFAEDLPVYEDWECLARLARVGRAAYLDCETIWNWGHRGPRLVKENAYARATARLVTLERVWGEDADFLAKHGDRFRREVRKQRLRRALWLLRQGRTANARAELAATESPPLGYRIGALLPGSAVRTLLAVVVRLLRDTGSVGRRILERERA